MNSMKIDFTPIKGQIWTVEQISSFLGVPIDMVQEEITQHQIAGRAKLYHTTKTVLYEYIG